MLLKAGVMSVLVPKAGIWRRTTASTMVIILHHFNPLAWYKTFGRQTELHHCICLGVATRYSPSPFTTHSPFPLPRHLCYSDCLPDGVIQTFILELGVGPWSQGLSQSVASAFVHPLSKVDRKVPKEAPMDHWVLNIFFPPPLCNRSPILFQWSGEWHFLACCSLGKKSVKQPAIAGHGVLAVFLNGSSPHRAWRDLWSLVLWLMGHLENGTWFNVSDGKQGHPYFHLLISRPIHSAYWDHTHSGHWFRMYTIPWWMVTHLCKAASPRGDQEVSNLWETMLLICQAGSFWVVLYLMKPGNSMSLSPLL